MGLRRLRFTRLWDMKMSPHVHKVGKLFFLDGGRIWLAPQKWFAIILFYL